jgi:ABC-type amino acid transport substrate-binding protein
VDGLAVVEKGLAEAFASDRGILVGLAITSKDPTLFALPRILFSYEPRGFMVQRNDAAFRLAVNRALAGLYRTGDIRPIYDVVRSLRQTEFGDSSHVSPQRASGVKGFTPRRGSM